MKEIANKAGVSVSTVSLVLNGRDEGRVKSKIADNVRAIATKLGYQSNPLASSLRTGRTHILGFISEEVATTPYAGGMILGRADRCKPVRLYAHHREHRRREQRERGNRRTQAIRHRRLSVRQDVEPHHPCAFLAGQDATGVGGCHRLAWQNPERGTGRVPNRYDATTRLVKADAHVSPMWVAWSR
mgnify:CR=1 FL=1